MNKQSIRPYSSVSHYIASELKSRRLELGLTGDGLAKLVYLSQQQVSRYERGMTHFQIETLYSFFIALNIDEDESERLMNQAYSYFFNSKLKNNRTKTAIV